MDHYGLEAPESTPMGDILCLLLGVRCHNSSCNDELAGRNGLSILPWYR